MTIRTRGLAAAAVLAALATGQPSLAQPPAAGAPAVQPPRPDPGPQPMTAGPKIIDDSLIAKNAAGLKTQSTDAKWKRDITIPGDWAYDLPAGVVVKQITFYVDGGTRLYGKIYYPKGFAGKGSWPAIVVGHGINALSIGIEKFASRFAERGFVAMAIDYQSYGFSDSGSDELQLKMADPSTDAHAVTLVNGPVVVKRTNLNNVHEVDDYRAAISYLQGEPGADANRIGIWGTSNAGTVVQAVSGIDGRVKATVVQVIAGRPGPFTPVPLTGPALDDAIVRVKTGQGGETTAGFSFPSNVDRYYQTRNRDAQSGALLSRVRPTTPMLYQPSERDELGGIPSVAKRAVDYLNEQGVPSQMIAFPGLTHFQPYSNVGFEVGSTLAADWFAKHLGSGHN